jgi:hypothetical protein
MADQLTFLHLPHDEAEPVVRGPRYVCEGRQMANFEARGLTPDEVTTILDP